MKDMDTEFQPNFGNRVSKQKKLWEIIHSSIRTKSIAEVAAMSLEEKRSNHYIMIEIDIPKTKKSIDKAIDKFIKDFTPLEDNGEQLLEFLGFYDDEAPYNEKPMYKELHEKITEEETEPEEIVKIVKAILTELPPEELRELWVFGMPVTEEEAKTNVEQWANNTYPIRILAEYATGELIKNYSEQGDDAITYSAKQQIEHNKTYRKNNQVLTPEEEAKEIEEYKILVEEVIKKYPKETQGYCRGRAMVEQNFSEKTILATIKIILEDEL